MKQDMHTRSAGTSISYETHALQWEGTIIEVRYCPDWSPSYRACYGYPLAHLEIDAQGIALPISATGYLSHFDRPDNITCEGGPVELVLSWLKETAQTSEWQAQTAGAAQLSLF